MTTDKKTNTNMELWNKVCTTDPDHVKKVNQRGGFTAIDAQYQLRLATEQWGPYGSRWGVSELDWSLYEGEIILEALFEYPGGGFRMAVDMPYKVGNECRKKLLTDFTTKALSKLGFNADVFEGLYDDNKYVAELKKEKASKAIPKQKEKAPDAKAEAEAEMSQAQLFKQTKADIMSAAGLLWPDKGKQELGALIKSHYKMKGLDTRSEDAANSVLTDFQAMIGGDQ